MIASATFHLGCAIAFCGAANGSADGRVAAEQVSITDLADIVPASRKSRGRRGGTSQEQPRRDCDDGLHVQAPGVSVDGGGGGSREAQSRSLEVRTLNNTARIESRYIYVSVGPYILQRRIFMASLLADTAVIVGAMAHAVIVSLLKPDDRAWRSDLESARELARRTR